LSFLRPFSPVFSPFPYDLRFRFGPSFGLARFVFSPTYPRNLPEFPSETLVIFFSLARGVPARDPHWLSSSFSFSPLNPPDFECTNFFSLSELFFAVPAMFSLLLCSGSVLKTRAFKNSPQLPHPLDAELFDLSAVALSACTITPPPSLVS